MDRTDRPTFVIGGASCRARPLLGWEPEVTFVEGLHRTIDPYLATKDPKDVGPRLGTAPSER